MARPSPRPPPVTMMIFPESSGRGTVFLQLLICVTIGNLKAGPAVAQGIEPLCLAVP